MDMNMNQNKPNENIDENNVEQTGQPINGQIADVNTNNEPERNNVGIVNDYHYSNRIYYTYINK